MRGLMRLVLNLGGPGGQGGGVTYLLRDEFLTDEAAPLTSPRAAEPGPGVATITGNAGAFSIAGGKLLYNGSKNDGRLTYNPLPRQAGLTAIFRAKESGIRLRLKFYHDFYFYGGQLHLTTFSLVVGSWISAIEQVFAVTLLDTGSLVFSNDGPYSEWTLLWVELSSSTASESPEIYGQSTTSKAECDYVRVRVLPAPFTDAALLATVNEAAPVSGTPYTATADAIHDLEVTAPDPLSGSAALRYRVTDANNYWTAYLNDAGAFRADSVAAGTPTNRVNVASVAVAAEARTIRVITNGTKHNYYTLAGTTWTKRGNEITLSHQDTATAIVPEATDYTLGALRSFPTTSAAYAELDKT